MSNFSRGFRDYKAKQIECQCIRCPAKFIATVVTRKPKYCDPCKAETLEEGRARAQAKHLAKGPREKLKPMPRLVPYAGYEPDNQAERYTFYRDFRKQG